MAKLPVVSGKEVIQVLQKFDYRLDRVNGSHHNMVKDGHPFVVTVPYHKELKRGTLRQIIRAAGLTVDEFVDALKG